MHSCITDGPLGCLHLLATVNNASKNAGGHISAALCFQFFWVYTPKWDDWIRRQLVPFSLLEEPLYRFPQRRDHCTCPLTVHQGSDFFPSSPTLAVLCFIRSSNPHGCELMSYGGFGWCLLTTTDAQQLHWPVGRLCTLLGEMATQVFAHFKFRLFGSLVAAYVLYPQSVNQALTLLFLIFLN